MLNVLEIMNENASISSAYMIDSCNLWHDRLGHVGFSYIKKMKDIDLLHNVTISDHDKCEYVLNLNLLRNHAKVYKENLNCLSLFIVILVT